MLRPNRMTPLQMNLADLTRMQRRWANLMTNTADDDGKLTEVEGFGSNPGELRMLTAIPAAMGAKAPLVVALHGCGQTASSYDAGSGWSALAERHGFAVLLPEQRRANNAHTCFNWFEPGDIARGEGEAASIRQMIAHCVAEHRLDPRRVFITGLSAGGAMTAVMLATYPEVFAAGAVIAGLPFGAAQGVQEALAVMHQARPLSASAWGDLVRAASPVRDPADRPRVAIWHGDADHVVALGNAAESVKQWGNVLGVAEADGVEDAVDGVPHRIWRGQDGSVRMELFTVPRLGHGTPITPQAEGDRGVGQVMPYILDSAISSTWRSAESWGLLGESVEAVEARPMPEPSLLHDPAALIARTLRATGLFGRDGSGRE